MLLFIQFVLYYCNIDLFKMYLKNGETNEGVQELEESKEKLKAFINELKQYDNII